MIAKETVRSGQPTVADHTASGRLEHFLDGIEKYHVLWLALLSLCYFAVAALCALYRPIWYDEYFSYALARLSFGDLWQSMMSGGDQHPVSFYWIGKVALAMGGHHLAIFRLPSMCGHWLAMLCVYVLVARRTSPLYGFVAMLFPLTTYSLVYAFEGRGYALAFGFSALALLCWDLAASGYRRSFTVPGLAASLALMTGSHYYSFLFVGPLALAELTRTVTRRKLDILVWCAFGGFVIPFVAFWPVIQASRKYATTFWSHPTLTTMTEYPKDVIGPQMAVFVVVVITLMIFTLLPETWSQERRLLPHPPVPAHERVALVAVMCMAVYVFLAYLFVTKAYHHRYALPAVTGFAILYAMAPARLTRRRLPALVLAVLLLFSFAALGAHRIRNYAGQKRGVSRIQEEFRPYPELAIVLSSADDWLRWTAYSPEMSPRLFYLVDPQAALRQLGSDTIERNIQDLRQLLPQGAVPYREFLANHPRFLLCKVDESKWPEWTSKQFLADGGKLTILGGLLENQVYLAESPAGQQLAPSGAGSR